MPTPKLLSTSSPTTRFVVGEKLILHICKIIQKKKSLSVPLYIFRSFYYLCQVSCGVVTSALLEHLCVYCQRRQFPQCSSVQCLWTLTLFSSASTSAGLPGIASLCHDRMYVLDKAAIGQIHRMFGGIVMLAGWVPGLSLQIFNEDIVQVLVNGFNYSAALDKRKVLQSTDISTCTTEVRASSGGSPHP